MFTKVTWGFWNAVRLAVVKSLYLVPIPITRSASAARRLAAGVPVAPTPPRFRGWSQGSEPPPAWLVPTGIPVDSANWRSASSAPA